jgi:hypothetical protein
MSPTPPPAPAPQIQGVGRVYAASFATALTTLLSWIHIDAGGELNNLIATMGNEASVSGARTNPGLVTLIAGLACGGITWAESSGTLPWDKGTATLVAVAAALLAAGGTLYLWLVVPSPMVTSFGLYLAIVASGMLAYYAWLRVQEFNRLRKAG